MNVALIDSCVKKKHLSFAMAMQRRQDDQPAESSITTFLLHPLCIVTQRRARHLPVLPRKRRPDPAYHWRSHSMRFWRWSAGWLPQFHQSKEIFPGAIRWPTVRCKESNATSVRRERRITSRRGKIDRIRGTEGSSPQTQIAQASQGQEMDYAQEGYCPGKRRQTSCQRFKVHGKKEKSSFLTSLHSLSHIYIYIFLSFLHSGYHVYCLNTIFVLMIQVGCSNPDNTCEPPWPTKSNLLKVVSPVPPITVCSPSALKNFLVHFGNIPFFRSML